MKTTEEGWLVWCDGNKRERVAKGASGGRRVEGRYLNGEPEVCPASSLPQVLVPATGARDYDSTTKKAQTLIGLTGRESSHVYIMPYVIG